MQDAFYIMAICTVFVDLCVQCRSQLRTPPLFVNMYKYGQEMPKKNLKNTIKFDKKIQTFKNLYENNM